MFDHWVLDVTLWHDDRPAFAWCPIEEGGDVVTGLTLIAGPKAPHGGTMVGVFHEGGQDAVEAWCAAHPEVMEELKVANP